MYRKPHRNLIAEDFRCRSTCGIEGWGLVAAGVVAAGTVAASAISSSGAKSAAGDQEAAANNANATQEANFQQIQANEAPWVTTGQQANSALGAFYGLPGASGAGGAGSSATPNYSNILSSLPGYQFQLQQGSQATDRDLAASGLLQSGAAGKALTTFGQGLAQNYAGQYTAGLTGLSQLGEAGAAGVASAGINTANQVGSNQIYAGNAAATGQVGSSNAINQGISGLAGLVGNYASSQQSPYMGAGGGSSGIMNTNFSPSSLFGSTPSNQYAYNTGLP